MEPRVGARTDPLAPFTEVLADWHSVVRMEQAAASSTATATSQEWVERAEAFLGFKATADKRTNTKVWSKHMLPNIEAMRSIAQVVKACTGVLLHVYMCARRSLSLCEGQRRFSPASGCPAPLARDIGRETWACLADADGSRRVEPDSPPQRRCLFEVIDCGRSDSRPAIGCPRAASCAGRSGRTHATLGTTATARRLRPPAYGRSSEKAR